MVEGFLASSSCLLEDAVQRAPGTMRAMHNDHDNRLNRHPCGAFTDARSQNQQTNVKQATNKRTNRPTNQLTQAMGKQTMNSLLKDNEFVTHSHVCCAFRAASFASLVADTSLMT